MASSGTRAILRAGDSDQQLRTEGPWSTAHRVAFRFAFCYFAQYIFFEVPYFTLNLDHKFLWNGAPILEIPWLKIVPWVAAHILGHPITGVGATLDSSYYWIKKFSFVLIAATITLVWSILDRKPDEYSKLDAWLRLFVRLSLACTLFIYGGAKVMPSQMPPPSLSRLIQPFGNLTPFHLLWNFMGASTFYQVLCGVVEMVCGVLLLIPGMTMLGALLSLAAVGQVILLNISYDVWVKLIPIHLALFALYLLIPYTPRIMNLFVFNRPTQSERRPPLFQRRGLNYLTWGAQWAVGFYFALNTLSFSAPYAHAYHEKAMTIPLYGIWDVQEFAADGRTHPPLLTDDLRWHRVVIDSEFRSIDKLTLTFEDMNEQWFPYLAAVDENNRKISLRVLEPKEIRISTEWLTSPLAKATHPDGPANISLNYTRPEPDELTLEGLMNGHQLRMTLKKEDPQFLLETHKNRFVHEGIPD
jgi:uncharacterized membrane protein YphA (DoxX/SURF4 family)